MNSGLKRLCSAHTNEQCRIWIDTIGEKKKKTNQTPSLKVTLKYHKECGAFHVVFCRDAIFPDFFRNS